MSEIYDKYVVDEFDKLEPIDMLPNYRVIKVKYIGRTDHKGERIKIWEEKRGSTTGNESKMFQISYEYGSILSEAMAILKRNGFTLVCRGYGNHEYVIMCDDFGNDFKHIKDLT